MCCWKKSNKTIHALFQYEQSSYIWPSSMLNAIRKTPIKKQSPWPQWVEIEGERDELTNKCNTGQLNNQGMVWQVKLSTGGGLSPVSYPVPVLGQHQYTAPASIYTHYNLLELLTDFSPHPHLPLATSSLRQQTLSRQLACGPWKTGISALRPCSQG